MPDITRCEGWRRTGGAFTLGRPVWEQCENDAVVVLEIKQEKVENMPSCMKCWNEAKANGIEILSVELAYGARVVDQQTESLGLKEKE